MEKRNQRKQKSLCIIKNNTEKIYITYLMFSPTCKLFKIHSSDHFFYCFLYFWMWPRVGPNTTVRLKECRNRKTANTILLHTDQCLAHPSEDFFLPQMGTTTEHCSQMICGDWEALQPQPSTGSNPSPPGSHNHEEEDVESAWEPKGMEDNKETRPSKQQDRRT